MVNAFITVRSLSSRLPRKCFLPFGDYNVLEHVIKRAEFYNMKPIVCTTLLESDDEIAVLASNMGVKCFRGSSANKLMRWRDCCRENNISQFHTVDADDPFFDGELMQKSIEKLNQGFDCVTPTLSSSAGCASVGYSLTSAVVERVCEPLSDDADTEMMWYYIQKLSDVNITSLDEIDDNLPNKLRLTLDYEEDYWLLKSVQRIVGNFATRKRVNDLFLNNPKLYLVNWFRNDEWAQAQLDKKI